MALNDAQVKKAEVTGKQYKLADGKGMYLMVTAKGAKSWRMDYRFNGKRKTLTLGLYPDVSLKIARARTQEARELIDAGIDPSAAKKAAQRRTINKPMENISPGEWLARVLQVDATSNSLPELIRLLRGYADYLEALQREVNHGTE